MLKHSSLCQNGAVAVLALLLCAITAQAAGNAERWLSVPVPGHWRACDSLEQCAGYNQQWWTRFGDPTLDTLVALAVENNYDLAGAARRIAVARAAVGQARAAYYPAFQLNAGYTRQRTSGRTTAVDAGAVTTDYFSGSVAMSWEVDVFGKITAQVRQQKANVQVSAAEYAGVLTSLRAQVASTYIGLLVSRAQLAVAHSHSISQAEVVRTAESRFEAGLASKLDVAQAKTMYYSTVAQIPLLEASIDASVNALCVLTAQSRADLPAGVYATDQPLPDWRQAVGVGVPLDLLRRRPDVVQAERQLDVAAAALGIARREYLPSLTIQGSVSTVAHRFDDLFSHQSLGYSIAPTLTWTIFDGFARRYAGIAAAETLRAQADAYNLAVITAIEEVRNAASRYSATLEYMTRTSIVVENAQESVNLSFDLYRQGLTPFTNVNDAELNYLTYENNLVSARGEALNALIDLYKALGGGWDPDNE